MNAPGHGIRMSPFPCLDTGILGAGGLNPGRVVLAHWDGLAAVVLAAHTVSR